MNLTTLVAILMTSQIRITCLISSSPQRLRNCRPSNVPSLKASCRMQSELPEPTTKHVSNNEHDTHKKMHTCQAVDIITSVLSRVFETSKRKRKRKRKRKGKNKRQRQRQKQRQIELSSVGLWVYETLRCGFSNHTEAKGTVGLWAHDGPEGHKMQRRITIMFLFAPCHTCLSPPQHT